MLDDPQEGQTDETAKDLSKEQMRSFLLDFLDLLGENAPPEPAPESENPEPNTPPGPKPA